MTEQAARVSTLGDALDAAFRDLGLLASDRQREQLLDFVALLAKWNRVYNLTAFRDVDDMLSHHVIDCLAVLEPLRRNSGDRGVGRVLDVGSGGGLPGLVIAVMEPSAAVTCVDAVGKKAAFLRHVATSLGLHNLRSDHARVETLRADGFDVITSRAFASLRDFVVATEKLLVSGGAWMAMKGKVPKDEIETVSHLADVFHVEPLTVPVAIGERCLVWMRPLQKVSASPA